MPATSVCARTYRLHKVLHLHEYEHVHAA